MKNTDQKQWERELNAHMRRHAADLHKPPKAPPEQGIWVTKRKVYLWTILVVIITSAGWAVGLYAF
ncbi:MAG: hypothetical protein ACRDRO_10840 [Pseudonocardiaceae bacterium]